MSSTQAEENPSKSPCSFFQEQINKLIAPAIFQLLSITKSYIFFNGLFLFLGFAQLLLLIFFFSTLTHSTLFSFSLSAIFLTIFSYMILRLYFQNRKPEQLIELKEQYLQACKAIVNYQEGVPEHHICLSDALCKLATSLNEKEYNFYEPPKFLQVLAPFLHKFSCYLHWEDLHHMKELLLLSSIEEQIKLVKCEPTNLEVHASCANAYVMLSALYQAPLRLALEDEYSWLPLQRYQEEMEEKFKLAVEKAMEEFKILNEYSPNDPWIHTQLAYSYHDLEMPQEEIKEYETILKLQPDDLETLFKLGMLYFQQGWNAKGLHIYEKLKKAHYKKAEQLIHYYGSDNSLI